MQHHIQFVKERLFVLMQASISFNYMSFETLQCFHFLAVFLYMWYASPNIFLAFSFLLALFYKKVHIVFLQWKTWYKMSLFINKISLKHINLCYSILINSWFFVFVFHRNKFATNQDSISLPLTPKLVVGVTDWLMLMSGHCSLRGHGFRAWHAGGQLILILQSRLPSLIFALRLSTFSPMDAQIR